MTAVAPGRYTGVAICLHWGIAGLLCVAFPLGLYMGDLPLSPDKLRLFSYHKWLGLSIFMLAVLRITWRLTHAPPPPPASLRAWERHAAFVVHVFLYVLVFMVPVSGWLMSSAQGFQTVWFGVLPLPDLLGRDNELAVLLKLAHQTLNYLMLALAAIHVLAALKHRFIQHDGVVARMLP